MEHLSRLLTTDARGEPSARHLVCESDDWDEIKLWSDEVYMPYRVRPTGPARRPQSQLYAVAVGGFTLSRFHYRIPIRVDEFSREAGVGMVLTSLRGAVRHWGDDGRCTESREGEAYLVDTSRTGYGGEFADSHLQLNLVFPHELMAGLYERWHGHAADESMWRTRARFGGADTSWAALLEYCARCATEMPEQTASGPLGRHLEEQLGLHMLAEWKRQHRDQTAAGARCGTLADVEHAEDFMREHAREVPTLSRIAAAGQVGVPALRQAFEAHRQSTPMAYLAEQRMLGVRAALHTAPPGSTVAGVAAEWGFANVIVFTAAYHRRFDEWPSRVLRRLRAA